MDTNIQFRKSRIPDSLSKGVILNYSRKLRVIVIPGGTKIGFRAHCFQANSVNLSRPVSKRLNS